MRIGEFDINQADGKVILNDIRLDTGILPRGHKLTKEDIIFLKMTGIKKISAAEMGVSDIKAENALLNLAPRICGQNAVYTAPERNICKIAAAHDGVFICQDNRISKFNRMSSKIALNTTLPYKAVKEGEVIATLSVFPPVVEESLLEEIDFKISGNDALLTVEPQRNEQAAVIYTKFYDDANENKHFSAIVRKMVKTYSPLGLEFTIEYNCPHTVDDIAEMVAYAASKHRVVMVIPGLPTNHPDDTVPAAFKTIVDSIVCNNIPQEKAHDLIIATKRNSKIIHIPYNYASVLSPLADKFIRIAINKDKVNQTDFICNENVTLDSAMMTEAEKASLIVPDLSKKAANDASVAAVILAAGISSRARRNKLMVKIGGKPLFMKAVEAAIKSKASPIFVITGYGAESLEEHLENIDINILRNHDYASGVKTSIRLGLRSVPSSCDGAVLIPADMPNISAEYINKMIKSFNKGEERQVFVASYKGRKHNPVLWSNDLYPYADLVPEESHMRQVLIEHSDYIKQIETTEDACLDVTFPNDLDILTKDEPEE